MQSNVIRLASEQTAVLTEFVRSLKPVLPLNAVCGTRDEGAMANGHAVIERSRRENDGAVTASESRDLVYFVEGIQS
ncbi:hypothetical protein ACFL2H_02865 [Planctomycetota bacterium]